MVPFSTARPTEREVARSAAELGQTYISRNILRNMSGLLGRRNFRKFTIPATGSYYS